MAVSMALTAVDIGADAVTFASTTKVGQKAIVAGSITFTKGVKMNEVYTSDGNLHQCPVQVEGSAAFEVHGFRPDLNSTAGIGKWIKFYNDKQAVAGTDVFTTEICECRGLLSASWDESSGKTKVDIKMTPSLDVAA